jgi:uncharacterized membrane protein YoaK (UPF0700 family)
MGVALEITIGIISLVIALVIAYFCHKIAVGKGRGPILWAVLGFLFPIIALIIIAVLPPKSPPAPSTT